MEEVLRLVVDFMELVVIRCVRLTDKTIVSRLEYLILSANGENGSSHIRNFINLRFQL